MIFGMAKCLKTEGRSLQNYFTDDNNRRKN